MNDIEGLNASQSGGGDSSNLGDAEISVREEGSHDWHPHTVKVMNMLREEMDETGTEEISFSKFVSGAQDRRTMAGKQPELVVRCVRTFLYVVWVLFFGGGS